DVAVRVDAAVNAERVAVNELVAQLHAFDATLKAKGELRYANALRYRAQGTLDRVAWQQALALENIEFDLRGDDEHITGNVSAGASGQIDARLRVDGELAYSTGQFNADIAAPRFAFTAANLPV